ncbi:MAG: class IV adenylate cyclase [Blastocatellia bacterium]|nr:class IV adenylate cyclase [Blastocatellia bacterium]
MARNVEIKAPVSNPEEMLRQVLLLATGEPVEIEQDDTFFHCPQGRLKLRAFPDGTGELIFYQRHNLAGPKVSEYQIVPTHCAERLRQLLTQAYGQVGRVKKRRILFWAGRTRIHFDRVEHLGNFLELEVVLGETEPASVGMQEAQDFLTALGISLHSLIDCAYVDLLKAGKPS